MTPRKLPPYWPVVVGGLCGLLLVLIFGTYPHTTTAVPTHPPGYVGSAADWRAFDATSTTLATTTTVVEQIVQPDSVESSGLTGEPAARTTDHEDESPPLGGSTAGGTFACIRHFESDGDYGERSNPTYRGAYQIGYQEWADMGGSGDPADASPAEQDMRAQRLQAERGWSPWSVHGLCGV